MPTGYTAAVKDGISFPEFAMGCARAFGACITLRDEPTDVPIPEEFKPSIYHQDALATAHANLDAFSMMSDAERRNMMEAEYLTDVSYRAKQLRELLDLKDKYQTMLEQVNKWTPPTPEHIELKQFMIQQLQSSIDFDCNTKYYQPAERPEFDAWCKSKLHDLEWQVQYHQKEYDKEVSSAQRRTEWVQKLRDSLK